MVWDEPNVEVGDGTEKEVVEVAVSDDDSEMVRRCVLVKEATSLRL